MTTKKETAKALEKSILHWERLSANPYSEGHGWRECDLCAEFLDTNCRGCPVYEETGVKACGNTPYEEASEAIAFGSEDDPDDAKIACLRQLKFLKSLRVVVKEEMGEYKLEHNGSSISLKHVESDMCLLIIKPEGIIPVGGYQNADVGIQKDKSGSKIRVIGYTEDYLTEDKL